MSDHPIFDYVLAVSLQNLNGKASPSVEYRFPPLNQNNKKDTLVDSIIQFCFPEADEWLNNKKLEEHAKQGLSESFSFVLTESDGSRRFGYCRRFIAKNSKNDLQAECYCILSLIPSPSVFSALLNVIEERRKKSSSLVFSFLKAVLSKEFPGPGESIVIPVLEGEPLKIQRSENDYLLDYVSFEKLFSHCELDTILDVFSAILCEARIILCSKSVSMLSDCVFALGALIYPFNWQHIYIPVLPKSLMTYCTAPMPFLVGVLNSNLNELNTYPIEEVVQLDVDTGKFLREVPSTCNHSAVLPHSLDLMLKQALKNIKKNHKQSTRSSDLGIAKAFLSFFYGIMQNYQKHMSNANKFDRAAFLDTRTPEVKEFLQLFSETQLYEMFIRDRESMAKKGQLQFCALSPDKFLETNLKTNSSIDAEERYKCPKCGEKKEPGDLIDKDGKIRCKDCMAQKKHKLGLRGMLASLTLRGEKEKETSSVSPSLTKRDSIRLTVDNDRVTASQRRSFRDSLNGSLSLRPQALPSYANSKGSRATVMEGKDEPKPIGILTKQDSAPVICSTSPPTSPLLTRSGSGNLNSTVADSSSSSSSSSLGSLSPTLPRSPLSPKPPKLGQSRSNSVLGLQALREQSSTSVNVSSSPSTSTSPSPSPTLSSPSSQSPTLSPVITHSPSSSSALTPSTTTSAASPKGSSSFFIPNSSVSPSPSPKPRNTFSLGAQSPLIRQRIMTISQQNVENNNTTAPHSATAHTAAQQSTAHTGSVPSAAPINSSNNV